MLENVEERVIQVRSTSSLLDMYVKIFHSELLYNTNHLLCPIIIIHGGPGLPHEYLLPIVANNNFQNNRAIIYYDQIGCGKSSAPYKDPSLYSIQHSIEDLKDLLLSLQLKHFILLGHSFGGILAYEFLISDLYQKSDLIAHKLMLVNTPCTIPILKYEINLIMGQLIMDGVTNEALNKTFKAKYTCRMDSNDLTFSETKQSKIKNWSGLDAISTWEIFSPVHLNLPVLVMRGEYDFVTERCISNWRRISDDVTFATISSSSHMPHIENPQEFSRVLLAFLAKDG